MPFRSRPDQPRDLLAQIEAEVRQRIEEAVDHVSLDVMVQRRRARGLPAPVPEKPGDRREFEAGVRNFLEHLTAELGRDLDGEARQRVAQAVSRAGQDPSARLVAAQVALARTLPDYWQRFEAVRVTYTAAQVASGGDGRGFLGRLLGR
jgi:hypothetical protein